MTSSSEVLEFESLRELLGRFVSSPLGRRELAKVEPHSDRERLEADLAEAGEAIEYLRLAARPQPAARGAAIRIDFGGLPDLEAAVHKLRIEGASLEPKEIFDLFALLDRAADAKSRADRGRRALPAARPRAPRPSAISARCCKDLEGKILPDGTVADHASVALGRLRRDIERQKKSIQESLERFLRAHREEGVLQEEFVTIRNERFVVPVIAGQRRKLDGVIHGASSSGHTLFVEPLETIDLNNELVRLARRRSARSAPHPARDDRPPARLRRFHPPDPGHHGRAGADFRQGALRRGFRLRHPALRRAPAAARRAPSAARGRAARASASRWCRSRWSSTKDRRTLLISGPNTGGKTVTLKTVGLLSLMAQSGLPVPAAEAEFPLFEQVLADIGDYQSIQENLSTFSAHMSQHPRDGAGRDAGFAGAAGRAGRRHRSRRRRRAGRGHRGALPRARARSRWSPRT